MNTLENKQLTQTRTVVLCLIMMLYVFIFYYFSMHHHRWFDETQAWQIAQSNSISEIWKALSFEGHPFLWYLVIYIPSKLFDISILSAITATIYALSCFYIFFKSPFPLIYKIILPLNFYFFYQYGVLARSYSLFILLAILAANSYNTRMYSAKFILYATLMSAVSFHSTLVSIGILMAFTVELFAISIASKKVSRTITRNFFILCAAAIFVALNIYSIIPPHDQYFVMRVDKNNVDFRRVYLVLTEAILENNIYWTNKFINNTPTWFQLREFFILLAAVLFYGNLLRLAFFWPTFLYVAIPMFGLFLGLMFFYANIYHFGLVVPLLLFSFWIVVSNRENRAIKSHNGYFYILFALIGAVWTFNAIKFEQKIPYSGLQDAAEYIVKNNITQIATDSVNALGVNAFVGRNIFKNVHTKPYFTWSKEGNIDMKNITAKFLLSNVPESKYAKNYRLVKVFPGKINSKGSEVSSDDTFYLYEFKQH